MNASRKPGLSVLSRITAAAAGGYALAAVSAIWISYVLPGVRADGVTTGLLISFAIYTAGIVWAFSARTATRAWAGIAVPALLFAALSWLAGPNGAIS